MLFTTLLAATGATLASALPLTALTLDTTPGCFNITSFSYGCTATCSWSLTISIEGEYSHHPSSLGNTVHLSGSTSSATDYILADMPSPVADTDVTTQVGAYIAPDTNVLKLKYIVNYPSETATYFYYGETQVYAETGPDAELQREAFVVQEDYSEGVAK